MTKMIAKGRLVLCALLLIAFFLPAYNGYSAFRFIPLALAEAADKNGVNSVDIMILLTPLLLVPATAAGIYLLFITGIALRRIYLLLPLVFSIFFLTMLFRSPGVAAAGGGLKGMQVGFYLMILSALALPLTKNAKRKKRKRIRRSAIKAEQAA